VYTFIGMDGVGMGAEEMDKDMQEGSMNHIIKPKLKILGLLSLMLIGVVACRNPADILVRILPEGERTGEAAETSLLDTQLVDQEPTSTASPQPRPLQAVPVYSATPTPEAPQPASEPQMYYHVQPGSPVGLPNIWHKELGCNWMGIGGQVFGREGWPEDETLVVELGGTLAGESLNAITLTGTATQWGPSGYEFTLGTEPVASQSSLWIQFFDIDGNSVSPRVLFDTYDDCERNAILLNMIHVERTEFERIFLPVLGLLFFPANP
jgi:hypothetical protein